MLTLDGSQGEGGGQILRTSLALALLTGTAFRIENLRARRAKPGLLRQHLTAVQAATEIGRARTSGAELGSRTLEFHPGSVRGGTYRFAVGTAGSAGLVLQTVLLPLLLASEPSELVLEGGTHNPFAPPFEFLQRCFLPQLGRMGARVELELEQPGFYPAGGGRMRARIAPVRALEPIELAGRGAFVERRARAYVAHLPVQVGERELAVVRQKLGWSDADCAIVELPASAGPGNVLCLEYRSDAVTELVSAFGAREKSSQSVGNEAVDAMRAYLGTGAVVGEHLADQLLLPLALARGGGFVSARPSTHASTNADVVRRFLDVPIELAELPDRRWSTRVGRARE